MTLVLEDKWIWDFWLAQDDGEYHIFYLQADRALRDQHLRHWNVSIGHAKSTDLKDWIVLPDALRPSPPNKHYPEIPWDNYTTWTGSVLKHDDLWYMFYTGTNHGEKGLVQRIGLATSQDLMTWAKHPDNPLIEADPRWYELFDADLWHDQAWRDPFVTYDNEEHIFHAFITGRVNYGEVSGRGVIAHATSPNLVDWTVHEPVTAPGEFGHMEVPQIVVINETYYLLFSCPGDMNSRARTQRLDGNTITGTYYLKADSLTGPYDFRTEQRLAGDSHGSLFSGKLVQDPDDQWVFLAFRNNDENGNFVGELIDPLPVTVGDDGSLSVDSMVGT